MHRPCCTALLVCVVVGCGAGGCDVGGPCGGPADPPCSIGTFCKLDAGSCGDAGAVGVCTLMPQICTLESRPVCGCDGITYANPCHADAAGVSIDHFGACDQPCCDPDAQPGVGANPPCFEGATCCADGAWRCNRGDGSTICDAVGDVCVQVCGGIAGLPCNAGEFCKLTAGECCCDFQGVCTPIPDACILVFDPVCGCDGTTYSNACFAEAAGVSVDHAGACSGG